MYSSFTATTALLFFTLATASPLQPLRQRMNDLWEARILDESRHGFPEQQVLQPLTTAKVYGPVATTQSTTTQTRTTTLWAAPLPSGEVSACNPVACASCRNFYACESGEPACSQCDTSQYCQCEAVNNKPERVTCSLGPGRTVPCDRLPLRDEHFYVFPSPDHDSTLPPATKSATDDSSQAPNGLEDSPDSFYELYDDDDQGEDGSHQVTCSLGPGRTVPCDLDSYAEVFEFGS